MQRQAAPLNGFGEGLTMTNKDEIKLLPCPFCGCEADEYTDMGRDIIECKKCSCNVSELVDVNPDVFSESLYEAWNTRADTSVKQQIEEALQNQISNGIDNVIDKTELLLNKLNEPSVHEQIEAMELAFNTSIASMRDECKAAVGLLQAKIDMLMLEYCPDEMTEDQMEEYSKHQVKSELELFTKKQLDKAVCDAFPKDNEIALLVNELTALGMRYGQAQMLRGKVSETIVEFINSIKSKRGER